MSHRPSRIGQQIQEEIARLLQRGLKDPRIGFVTITGAEVDRELRHATIYYSLIGEQAEKDATQEGLQSAAGFLRRELAKALKLRHTPELSFKFDASVEHGDKIERLIREVHKNDEKK